MTVVTAETIATFVFFCIRGKRSPSFFHSETSDDDQLRKTRSLKALGWFHREIEDRIRTKTLSVRVGI
jgi:hypothetical protein